MVNTQKQVCFRVITVALAVWFLHYQTAQRYYPNTTTELYSAIYFSYFQEIWKCFLLDLPVQRILDKLYGISLKVTEANRLIKRWHVMVDVPF